MALFQEYTWETIREKIVVVVAKSGKIQNVYSSYKAVGCIYAMRSNLL